MSLIAGTRLPSGCGFSTVLPDFDFEVYSEAGFIWDDVKKSYYAPKGATKKGLFAVGAVAYTEHPSSEILSLAYDLKDCLGPRLWIPRMAPPQDLFNYLATGGLIEAWNDAFEYWCWLNICAARMGWPDLPFWQLRDAMAKARAHALPGALGNAAKVCGTADQKLTDGKRLINKFCIPRKPTLKDPRRRIRPEEDPVDAMNLYTYCIGDIKAEAAVSALCPDLSPDELEFWLCTRAGNVRGLGLDMETVHAGAGILDLALVKYNRELSTLTGGHTHPITGVWKDGVVKKASEVAKLTAWLGSLGAHTGSLDAEAVEALLAQELPAPARRALEIRQLAGSAGVKKLYAMQRMASKEGRAHDLLAYHAARTGRDGGQDIQPQNLVKQGPKLYWCEGCGEPYGQHRQDCPHCGVSSTYAHASGWSWKAVEAAVKAIRTGSLDHVEKVFGDALLTLSGCIRGLFVPAPGKDFLCSDYSSIEAVVTAVLAGCKWRIEAFRNQEDIYLASASKMTGISVEEYLAHPDGPKGHPDRQYLGKPNELACGFGGWIAGYRVFDKTDTFTDDQVKKNILAWRAASPEIVELWGGQVRGFPWDPDSRELFGLEGMAINAIQNPGTCYAYNGITYGVKDDVLYCRLLSGRYLTYHHPRLAPSDRWDDQLSITFEGWNSNPTMGRLGWITIQTYGGRLAENVVQATARDIMAYAVPRLERAGYPIVLRVHDELVAEVPEGTGYIQEFEHIMCECPEWAKDWPIRASGWRGKRYRKD